MTINIEEVKVPARLIAVCPNCMAENAIGIANGVPKLISPCPCATGEINTSSRPLTVTFRVSKTGDAD